MAPIARSVYLVILLTISCVHSFLPQEIKLIQESKGHVNPKRFLYTVLNPVSDNTPLNATSPLELLGANTGSLSVSPSTTITSDSEWLTVSWSHMSYTSKYDWIGVFNASAAEQSFAAPPIKYQYICPAYNNCKNAPSSGSLKFRLLNRRTSYIFAYITPSNPYRETKGLSPIITYTDADLYKPMHVHIATPSYPINAGCGTSSKSCMQVMWVQKAIDSPEVQFGTDPSSLKPMKASNFSSISPSDYCDQTEGLPAGTTGYFDLGNMITTYLLNLKPDTQYFYKAGDATYGYSELFNFTSPPAFGSMVTRDSSVDSSTNDIRMIVFGDMGNVAIDYSMHHSWDWGNKGEIYSINTTRTIAEFSDGRKELSDAVIHIGDISYAVGFLSEWDDFMHQMTPVGAYIPWMTGIGNHEYAWTGEWKPPAGDVSSDAYGNADGGGECGVPYNFYFPFANANQEESREAQFDVNVVQPWYVFDFGTVRCFVISTEHDYSQESEQYKWLEGAMKGTDRSLFPWLFVAGHRPMYANSPFDGDATTSQYLIDSMEGLLVENKVALGFWGHQHSYGRTCPVTNGTCMEEGEAAVHLIVGMAGYELARSVTPLSYTVFQNCTVYGFVHLTLHNESVMSGKFVNAESGEIVDSFNVVNPFKY